MSTEVNVADLRCGAAAGGLSCLYCYQGTVRNVSGNDLPRVDHAAIRQALEASGADSFSLFGGEPLLASLEDLTKLWEYGLERYGTNGVQTSGRPITEEHFQAFKRFKVHVGFSIDGPGPLNDARVAGSVEETREATRRSIEWLLRCLREGVACSIIVTLHRLNAARHMLADGDRLPQLVQWLEDLDAFGLRDARVHVLEQDGPHAKALALTPAENVEALVTLRDLERRLRAAQEYREGDKVRRHRNTLRFDVFSDLVRKLRDPFAKVTCIWEGCDPWVTPAVHGIEADGSRSLCQRVNKDGRKWMPLQSGPTRIRQAILWATPQADGGCQGCRFFLQCRGQCPGTAIDGDWRKRSADCATWYGVLERLEGEMLEAGEKPASLHPDLPKWVQGYLADAAAGVEHLDREHGDRPHGDHYDAGPQHLDSEAVRLEGGEEVHHDSAPAALEEDAQ